MRIVVDLVRCQTYGQCVFAAPTVFELHGEQKENLECEYAPDESLREQVERAAACPVQAISIGRAKEQNEGEMTSGSARSGRAVIVGASLAGLRAAEALRAEGFAGSLALIGDEPYEPYDKPPLCKRVLAGRMLAELNGRAVVCPHG